MLFWRLGLEIPREPFTFSFGEELSLNEAWVDEDVLEFLPMRFLGISSSFLESNLQSNGDSPPSLNFASLDRESLSAIDAYNLVYYERCYYAFKKFLFLS